MLMEKYEKVPIKKTYTCNPAEFDYLDRAQNKLRVPMHYVLKNDKANHLGLAPLQYGKVRISSTAELKEAPPSWAKIGENSPPWMTR